MKRMREVLRLRLQGYGHRPIAGVVGVGRTTVQDFLHRVEASGLKVSEALELSDSELSSRIMKDDRRYYRRGCEEAFFRYVSKELKSPSVTLMLLWEEYRVEHPGGYSYSEFCAQYRRWRNSVGRIWMHQEHKAGDKVFIDYAGDGVEVICTETGEIRRCSVFVAVLGASNLTYVEATDRQDNRSWICAQMRAFGYFGGVPQAAVPDNPKPLIKRSNWYDPELNQTYAEFAKHYNIAILPARVRHPKDKAKVEVGVQLVQRWIVARLRKMQFFSTSEVNAAIVPLVEALNGKKMRAYGVSRRELFEQIERSLLQPLPKTSYMYADWKTSSVGVNYHVEFERNHYSAPFHLIHSKVELKSTELMIELYNKGELIAVHPRAQGRNQYVTHKDHMPHHHRHTTNWTPERLTCWARDIGPETELLTSTMFVQRRHPEQAIRAVLGLLSLEKKYSRHRLEGAAKMANRLGVASMMVVANILRNNKDHIMDHQEEDSSTNRTHDNIRGREVYH